MGYRQISTEISYEELIKSPCLWLRYWFDTEEIFREMEEMVKKSHGGVTERFIYDDVLSKSKTLGVKFESIEL